MAGKLGACVVYVFRRGFFLLLEKKERCANENGMECANIEQCDRQEW